MNFYLIFVVFLIWRLIDFLIIILAKKFVPYLGFFPYTTELYSFKLPQWLTCLGNFDGIHYLLIAQRGYQTHEQAFFPLYPLLIRYLNFFLKNEFLAAFLISNISFLFGLYFIKKIFENRLLLNTFYLILFLLLYPTSFYFGAIYTEGLFFLLMSLTLYNLKKNRLILASITSFFASLTRIIGVFLFIPIFFHLCRNFKKKKIFWPSTIIVLLSPFLGIFLYSLYLWQTTGDPLFFFTSQPAFGANRSTKLISLPQVYFRYLKIFFTANFNFQYFVALIEFFFFTYVFVILLIDFFQNIKIKLSPNIKYQISNLDNLSLNLFSLANLLLPTLTGTFSSIPRYTLFSLSFFIFLAKINSFWIKFLIAIVFLIFHVILLAFFAQGYFVS